MRFFKVHGQDEEFCKTKQEMDICPECHKKILTAKIPAPEVTAPVLKQAEKKTRNDNIDDGKIWALAHAKKPWTIEAIAEECRCSTATVYNHLKRMREERGEK